MSQISTAYLNELACKQKETNKLLKQLASGTTATPQGTNITVVERCDDVLNNGSNIVKVYEASYQTVSPTNTVVSTFLGYFSDAHLTTSYTPSFIKDCDTLGNLAKFASGRISVTVGDWSPNSLIKSYSVRVVSTAGGVPTFTDSFGNITNFVLGEVVSFEDEELLVDITPIVTVPAGSEVIITYTQII